MSPNYSESVRFLEWWLPGGPWVLTAIEPERTAIATDTFRGDDPKRLLAWLEKQGTTRNIYFHVNPCMGDMTRKAERADVARLSWLHVDIDPRAGEDIDKEQQRALKLLQDFQPAPSAIVFSGGGYQGFWRLSDGMEINGEEAKFEQAKRYNLQLEILFGADNCHNVDRIMRLPGTINRPDAKKKRKGRKPALASVVELHDDRVYELASFTKAPEVQTPGMSQGSRRVQVSGNIPRLNSVDDLGDGVPDLCKVVIVQGTDPDDPKKFTSRSEALLYVCCELVRSDISDDTIYSVITDKDFRISDSVLDKGSNAEKYALRQIARAHDLAVDPDLFELNEKCAVISSIGGKCRVIFEEWDYALKRPRIVRQSFEDFRNSLLNRKKVVGKNKDGIDIKKPLGHWWLEHENRRQFKTMVFAPGQDTPDAYNLWQGFAYEAIPGDCSLFLEHVRHNLCQDDPVLYEYLIKWAANMVQNPGEPGQTAVVLRGAQGTGKGTFATVLGSLLGRHFMHVSNPSHLVGNFNSHLRDCVVLFGDEAFYAGDKRHESVLKTLITENLLTVEAKGVDVEVANNCVHLIMASNESWVVPAGLDDRRFFVLDVSAEHARDSRYFGAVREQLAAGGYSALLHHLLSVDLKGFDVRQPPRTAALQQQKLFSMSPEEEWWFGKLSEGKVFVESGEWDTEISRHDLLVDYINYTKQLGTPRRGNATKLGQFMAWVVPGLQHTQKRRSMETRAVDGSPITIRRPHFYVIPKLEACRGWWDDKFGGPYDWPEVEQVDDGEDADDGSVF